MNYRWLPITFFVLLLIISSNAAIYDDFESGTLNVSKWNATSGISVSSDYAHVPPRSGAHGIYSMKLSGDSNYTYSSLLSVPNNTVVSIWLYSNGTPDIQFGLARASQQETYYLYTDYGVMNWYVPCCDDNSGVDFLTGRGAPDGQWVNFRFLALSEWAEVRIGLTNSDDLNGSSNQPGDIPSEVFINNLQNNPTPPPDLYVDDVETWDFATYGWDGPPVSIVTLNNPSGNGTATTDSVLVANYTVDSITPPSNCSLYLDYIIVNTTLNAANGNHTLPTYLNPNINATYNYYVNCTNGSDEFNSLSKTYHYITNYPPLNDSLTWRFTFNNTADNIITSDCNITNPKFGYDNLSAAPGPFSYTANFNANASPSDTYVGCAATNSQSTMTLCTWLMKASSDVQYNVYAKGSATYRWQYTPIGGGYNVGMYFQITGESGYLTTGSPQMDVGKWYWLCAVHNTTGKYWYVNGILSSYNNDVGTTESSGDFYIGSNGVNTNELFAGQMSDSILWQRSLESYELASMYDDYMIGIDPFAVAPTVEPALPEGIVVNLSTPANASWTSDTPINFTYDVQSTYLTSNCSLYVNSTLKNASDNLANGTVTVPVDGLNTTYNTTYTWRVECVSANLTNVSETRTLYYITTYTPPISPPLSIIILPTSPTNGSSISVTPITFSYIVQSTYLTSNCSLYVNSTIKNGSVNAPNGTISYIVYDLNTTNITLWNWKVNCTSNNLTNTTETRYFSWVPAGPPTPPPTPNELASLALGGLVAMFGIILLLVILESVITFGTDTRRYLTYLYTGIMAFALVLIITYLLFR